MLTTEVQNLAHTRCKNLSNSLVTQNKEIKKVKRSLDANETPARVYKTKNKFYKLSHWGHGKPRNRVSFEPRINLRWKWVLM